MSPEALAAATGWLLFAALVLLIGSVTARWAILPFLDAPETLPGDAWLERRSAAPGLVGALLMPAALALVFYRQLQEFRDPFVPWTEDAGLLLSASWGTSFKIAAVASFLAVIGLLLARWGRGGAGVTGWIMATAGAGTLAVFPGLTGHAAGSEATWLTLPADALHVLAAGAWMGGLAVVLYMEGRWRQGTEEIGGSLLPDVVPVFSRVAVVSVATLVATGAVASWLLLPEVSALWTTEYGRTLSVKLGLVAVVLALGGVNFRILTPRLRTAEGPAAMRKAAALELALGTAVLLVTAVLVRMSPTGG